MKLIISGILALIMAACSPNTFKFKSTDSGSASVKTSSCDESTQDCIDEDLEDGVVGEDDQQEYSGHHSRVRHVDYIYNHRCNIETDEEGNEVAVSAAHYNNRKVEICHIPGGNPGNAHTICISENALKAHIGRHGHGSLHDYYGECKEQPEQPEEPGTEV